jgi:hypothetical protein
MMGHRAILKGGGEYDAFSRKWRKLYCYLENTKALRKIKRAFWKRQRRQQRFIEVEQ